MKIYIIYIYKKKNLLNILNNKKNKEIIIF